MPRLLLLISLALSVTLAASASFAGAQLSQATQTNPQVAAALPDLAKAIAAEIGMDPASVEVKAARFQLVVTLINSKLADAGTAASAREVEALKVVSAITKKISGKPEFKSIQALHIDYVTRRPNGGDTDLVDGIDFRKNPQGRFTHHVS